MAKLEAVGAVLVVAALFTGASAAVPGPNDLRYPDYIVNPPVQCSVEGSFHHPRNCSWYYRCVDRMKIGYFHTFHFECEPGTVFSDELDQCVFPHLVGPPCGTAGQGPVTPATPPPTPPCIFYDQDCRTEKLCNPSEERVFCDRCRRGLTTVSAAAFCGGAGLVFDKGLGRCVPIPSESRKCTPTTPPTPAPIEPCIFYDQDCRTEKLCNPSEERVFCDRCRRGLTTVSAAAFCGGAGLVFDKGLGRCVPIPSESRKCTPTTPPTPAPIEPCIFYDQDCRTEKLCNPSEERVFCDRCRRGLTTVSAAAFCGGAGLVFDKGLGRCVPIPSESRKCPPTTTNPPTTGISTSVSCVFNSSVCEERELCQPKETVTLCRHCYFGSTLIDYCGQSKGMIYDLDLKKCVAEPDATRECQAIPPTGSPTGSLTCSFDDSVCEKRVLCNPSETRTLCRQCYIGETLIDYCGQSKGLIYDLDLNQCVEEPGDSRVCGASVTGENTVECSDTNTRPGHDWIKRFFCTRYNLCGPNNSFKETVSLCTNYYQCYKNTDGTWNVEKRNCVGNKLYSFDSDSCEDEPSEDQLCT
ncbi:uncharacterized protein LOC134762924 [Penaeus indicus]|uniref:uncharacterized protein LOC134762924 n=1 Tax=Penaeus indicus TaxID=29960 RepID=UPI00300CA834